jgi:hypothetical protein
LVYIDTTHRVRGWLCFEEDRNHLSRIFSNERLS